MRKANDLSEISPQILEFGSILKPLKEFTYYSEKRETKLSKILPKMKETFDALINVKNYLECDESKYVVKFVLATFLARMQTLPLDVIKTAYAISIEGREHIREIASLNIRENYGNIEYNISEDEDVQENQETTNHQDVMQEQNENAHPENAEIIPQTFEIPIECDLENETEIEEVDKMITLEQAVEQTQKLMSTQKRHAEFIQIRDSLMGNPELENYDWFTDLIPIAEETLERQAHLLEAENYEYLTQELRKWWFEKDLKGYLRMNIQKTYSLEYF